MTLRALKELKKAFESLEATKNKLDKVTECLFLKNCFTKKKELKIDECLLRRPKWPIRSNERDYMLRRCLVFVNNINQNKCDSYKVTKESC